MNTLIYQYQQIVRTVLSRQSSDHNRSKLLYLLINLYLVAGFVSSQKELLWFSIPLIILLEIPRIARKKEPVLQMNWDRDTYRIYDQHPIKVRLNILNEGHDLDELKITVKLPEGLLQTGGTASLITSLPRGGTTVLEFHLKGPIGTYELTDVEVIQPGPLRLDFQKKTWNEKATLYILPLQHPSSGFPLRPRNIKQQLGMNLSRLGGEGVEIFGIRPYQYGDPMRYIHGRSSAKHLETLFAREFEKERAAAIQIMLDTQALPESSPLKKQLLQTTATLCDELLRGGNRVGLMVYGCHQRWIPPGSGKIQKEKIIRSLSLNDQSGSFGNNSLNTLLIQQLNRGTLLVLISPLLRTDASVLALLKGLRYQLLVISPDTIVSAKTKEQKNSTKMLACRLATLERGLLIRKLGKQGIPVLNLPLTDAFLSVVKRFLGRYWP